MGYIVEAGSINLDAINVPNLIVEISTPDAPLNGVSTSTCGVVGTASFGPVNQPVVAGSLAQFAANFGALTTRAHDVGTAVAIAVQQGANDFRIVRVTDGTDYAASATLDGSGMSYTALHSGTVGNDILVSHSPGLAAGTTRVTVQLPGVRTEVFDNLSGSSAGLMNAISAAINSGTGTPNGPSRLVVAFAGTGTSPTGSVLLEGGTDGADGVTDAMLIGSQASGTGMYALAGSGCAQGMLADLTDYGQYSVIEAFGESEGIFFQNAGPSGEAPSDFATSMAGAGVDGYALKALVGDYVTWNDQVNGVVRVVSPAAWSMGKLGALSPEQSSLNKRLIGIVGTQTTGSNGIVNSYTDADLSVIAGARGDVITSPSPGGQWFSARMGANCSSNTAINGDNYSRMVPFLAKTFNKGLGQYLGDTINTKTFARVRSTVDTYLNNLVGLGILASLDGTTPPYLVYCSINDGYNSVALAQAGYLICTVFVALQPILTKFIVNMTAGQSVTTTIEQMSGKTLASVAA